MKKYKRRKFLLFATQAGASVIIGSLNKCSSTPPQQKTKSEKEMNELKEEIRKLVKEGKVIKLKWDCGGDEAHVGITVDGEKIDYHSEIFQAFEIHVINQLNLPDVGEFIMEGEGILIEESGEIYIEYESIMKGLMNYGERGENPKWVEMNEKEEAYSGKKKI